jgi:hypothetical protein
VCAPGGCSVVEFVFCYAGEAMKTTTRRQVLATMPAIATAMTGSVVVAESSAEDPVLAAIGRHRQATQAWQQHNRSHRDVDLDMTLTKAELEREGAIVDRLLEEEGEARFAWATTQPTTMAGIIATLEYAGMEGVYGMDTTPLFEGGGAPQFPRMIVEALRKISNRGERAS